MLVLSIFLALITGAITSEIADRRHRKRAGWFFVGLLLSVVGIVLVLVLRPGTEPAEPAAPPADEPKSVAVQGGHGHEVDAPPLARAITHVDDFVGRVERAVLFLAFAALVFTGLYRTIADLGFAKRPLWAIELSRVSAFSIGMIGAAYAAQSRRNFGLDLVSALMGTKVKAVVRVFTNLFTLIAAGLLLYAGQLIHHALTLEKQHYDLLPPTTIALLIPIAAGLIAFHVVCHVIIEVDYLRQGKTAPEPELAG
ncbi:MAG TPA: TRAP transporter small permease [Kofleriaceae bacterium]|nr:TRAP transporter small permease [Kofleriaceae bacterium]